MLLTACAKPIDPKNGFEPVTCPAAIYLPYHQVMVNAAAIPAKVAVYVNGVLKVDECNQVKQTVAPIVDVDRVRAALKVKVTHGNAYPVLPTEMALEIHDLGDCTAANVFLKEDHLPLTFKTEYPNGKKCGGVPSAKIELSKAG